MSLFEDMYSTIEGPAEGVFKDKGSKFIAYAYPFPHESSLKPLLASLVTLHPKARHHCWAYRLGSDRSVFRVNDDGEPSGSAGRPILNVLLSRDLTNILVVVVRYFGGTLLGVPGLINAYKTATQEALDQAIIVQRSVSDVYDIAFAYAQTNAVMRVLKELDVNIIDQQFDNNCVIKVAVRQTLTNALLSRLHTIMNTTTTYLYTI